MDTESLRPLKTLSLLYVEDDEATREELAMMLEPWVARLDVARDGQEGLEKFVALRPDLVLTDIQMPHLSGLAMGAEIRRLVADQPIIVLSAYNDVEYLFRAIELGIDQYITKPVNVERLIGKLARMAEAISAVRERKRSNALLEQYKHLVDQSALVCKLDTGGRIIYVNDKLCEISGFTPEDLIGQNIEFLRHAVETPYRTRDIIGQVQVGHRWSGIVRNRTRDGELYVVESSLVPIRDENGVITEIVSLDVDITPLYENYENLVEALSRSSFSLKEQHHFLGEYKRALELGTCVCVTDRAFNILSINRQFETLLGYHSEALLGRPVGYITTDFAGERCLDMVQTANQENFISRIVRFHSQSGTELQFSVVCVGVRSLAGEIESIIMICQDITESLRLNKEIVETQRELLYMLGDVVESRSVETAEHVRRVAQVSKFLALKIGLDGDTASMIETAAPMHDVGKVGIPDAILNKPGRLDAAEFEQMKQHARIGHNILGKVDRPLIALAATIASQHHERWDGQGYPHGLQGDQIDIAGRIVAIADVLDALSSERMYKPAWNCERVREYFKTERGRQFDPALIDILLANWDTVMSLRDDKPAL